LKNFGHLAGPTSRTIVVMWSVGKLNHSIIFLVFYPVNVERQIY